MVVSLSILEARPSMWGRAVGPENSFASLIRPQLLAPKALGQNRYAALLSVPGCAPTTVHAPSSGAKKYLSVPGSLCLLQAPHMCSVLSFYQQYLRVLGSLSKTTLKGSSSTSHGPSRDCPLLRDPAGDVSSDRCFSVQ